MSLVTSSKAVLKVRGLAAARRCYAEREAVTVMTSCSGGGKVVVA
jgi:hypothetical protein